MDITKNYYLYVTANIVFLLMKIKRINRYTVNMPRPVLILIYLTLAFSCKSVSPVSEKPRKNESIHINQTGYLPNSEKTFLIPAETVEKSKKFSVIEQKTGTAVFEGILAPETINDLTLSGLLLARGDFTNLTAPGTYRIRVGKSVSSRFSINPDIYLPLAEDALRSLSLVRANMEIHDAETGLSHSAGHHSDRSINGRDFSGGWYNAGDYGKWTHCSAITAANLLTFYMLNAENSLRTNDGLRIPESGNGIPDILDEARWGIEWLIKMQNADGSVYHKVDSEPDFAWGKSPEEDPHERTAKWTDRNGKIPSTIDAADFCGALGLASRVFKPIDPGFSGKCAKAALRTWQWLKLHPDNPQTDPYYTDYDPAQELFWAAAEIYLLTNREEGENIITASPCLYLINPTGWQTPELIGTIALLESDMLPATLRNMLEYSLRTTSDSLLAKSKAHAFGHSADSFWWGSNQYVLGTGQILAYAAGYFGNEGYRQCALDQLHYLLGRNALGISFTCGHGEVSVRHPYHWAYYVYGVALPGWMAGGPNASDTGGDRILEEIQNKGTPPALHYADVCGPSGSYASNEGTITMSSSLVLLAGMF